MFDAQTLNNQFASLCQTLAVTIDRRGEAWCACPFCGKPGKHFSFSIRARRGRGGYNCFVCQEHGSLATLVKHVSAAPVVAIRPPMPQRDRRPADWTKHPDRYLESILSAPTRLTDWQRYKPVSIESVSRWRLGVGVLPASRCKHRRLIVPVFAGGKLVALHGRAYRPDDDDGKWLTAADSSKQVLFNADMLYPSARVIIVENFVDAILTMQSVPGVVAVAGGGAAWHDDWTAQIVNSKPDTVLVWLDHDLAGNGSRYHHAELVAEWRTKNPLAKHIPEPAGPKIANTLIEHGINAKMYVWPRYTPLKADIGWLLMQTGVNQ